ncbi:D-sedoheptulose-7-phosphate isomerase [Permianibacter aggregans]|uniref:Phosphoheptose isomerase n=1 Tax=Permianibacter aggregans TaxID=1510150 RepID=A0A4R6V4N3_9GAMM|nr:SIS domain-containing protein [Permianibacter aggregans]QGX41328.1 SIS domain-containing protein [Permianibacter aggregans]TDQ51114.1 D-sedoheptulose 7-phosphate isomerase [Permianibacter aggregans]
MLNYKSLLSQNVQDSIHAKKSILEDSTLLDNFNAATECLVECYKRGGRLYIAGNGGSAADSQHLAAEFVSKLARDRNPLPSEALTTDSSILTAIGNDYGYQYVFSRQLQAKLQPNDVFLAITTSGMSQNIVEALNVCKEKNVKSILLTGRDGGRCAEIADFNLIVPGTKTSTIQELHIVLAHTMCEAVETKMFFENT